MSTWPPQDEPVTVPTVVGRLEQLGWHPSTYALLNVTERYALLEVTDVVYEPYVLVNLVSGGTVAEYETQAWAERVLSILRRRESEDES